jgi:hypothetical protein
VDPISCCSWALLYDQAGCSWALLRLQKKKLFQTFCFCYNSARKKKPVERPRCQRYPRKGLSNHRSTIGNFFARGPSWALPYGQAGCSWAPLLVGPPLYPSWLLVGPLLTLPLAADFWIRRRQTSRREFPIGTMRKGGPLEGLKPNCLGVRPPLERPPGGPPVGVSRFHTPLNGPALR